MEPNGVMYKYWGKASKDDSRYHLLVYHSLDVAAVAGVWWDNSPTIRRSFVKSTGLNEEQTRAWVLFFIGLHDLGKLDFRFQMKVALLAPYDDKNLLSKIDCKKYYHGEQGYYWYSNEAKEYRIPVIEKYDCIDVKGIQWMSSTAGHHGSIPNSVENNSPGFVDQQTVNQDQQARKEWIQALEDLFLRPVDLALTDVPVGDAPILLAGFCSVCDWLGSNQEYFEYLSEDKIKVFDYFQSRRVKASQVLDDFGLLSVVKTKGGMSELFDFSPRNVQTRIGDLDVKQSLVMIEANTGSGKTEAAFAFASKLLANNHADSITFALPSQATANAMLGRLVEVASNIFKDKNNLILAHGKSQSNPGFQKLIHDSELNRPAQGDEEAGVQCSEWLSSSRKRAFLGQIAVSTVDQVMLSAIKSLKHYFVRIFGVGKSVLIIDEVHAYDAYMYGILKVVIAQQKLAGGSVILLSATLPKYQKQALVEAWGVTDDINENAYPLILQAGDNGIRSFTLDPRLDNQSRTVDVELVANDEFILDHKILQRIVEATEKGAKVGIVCNLVDDAQYYAKVLAEMTDAPVDLFHSRYRYCDRMERESQVLEHYNRVSLSQGRILVGTQVIEQSLDIDFDWMISFICPVDLLFQRIGRLHRHEKLRPVGFEKPLCSIVLPENINLTDNKSVKDAFGLHGFIYKNTRALWRTQQLLSGADSIFFPLAYRDWIERVYQPSPWEDESEVITSLYEEYANEQYSSDMVARGLTKDNTYFSDTEGNAALLTREGELNLSVIPILKLDGESYFLDEQTKVPKPDDKFNREVLSQNSLAVPSSKIWRSLLPECKDGIYYLVMNKTEIAWEYKHKNGDLLYTTELGLERINNE